MRFIILAAAAALLLPAGQASAEVLVAHAGITGEDGTVNGGGINLVDGHTYYYELITDGVPIYADMIFNTKFEYFLYREDGSFDLANDQNCYLCNLSFTKVGNLYFGYVTAETDSTSYWDNGNIKRQNFVTQSMLFDVRLPPGTAWAVSISAVPEPATWAFMVAGFGLIGATLRRSPSDRSRPLEEIGS